MRVLHHNNIDFNIDADGEITRRSIWHVMPDEDSQIDSGWINLREQAEEWAGDIGAPWRLPTADSTDFTEDGNYIVQEISFKSKSRYVYEVTFDGGRKHLSAEIQGGVNETIDNSGESVKTATWLVHADSLTGWLPEIGGMLSWAGSDFLCENIQLNEHHSGEWEVKITARDTSVMMIGQPLYSHNSDHENTCKAKWRVSLDSYSDFIAANGINSDASSWAGADYYISDVQTSAHGNIAYYVSLEAAYIESRLLNVKYSESLDGYDINGNIRKNTSWTAHWRIPSDMLEDFENLVGESAADWASADAIITKVDPVRINDLLYEVSLEAKDPENSGNFAFEYNSDDRSKLGSRKDINCRETDYILSASQCGWFTDSNGKYEEIPDWEPELMCPFTCSEALSPKIINARLKCVQVKEAEFLKGRSKSHVSMNLNWSTSSRVESSVAGVAGSWLKQSFETEEVFDNEGKRWTKVIRSYLHAPAGMTWNASYGGH
ncbi:MAG: hypothetical protein PHV59_08570 [Victivallales bacterium]|nr:hypothetical protein [Victivallales bacterium]